jgi:hypothetical protein
MIFIIQEKRLQNSIVLKAGGGSSLQGSQETADFTYPSNTMLATRIYLGDKSISFNIKQCNACKLSV